MLTTIRSSNQKRGRWIQLGWGVGGCVLVLTLLAGCVASIEPAEVFQLTPESLRNKAMQVRVFETSDEKELLSASAAALQDLGFEIEESVWESGFLRAAKERSAREWGQHIGRFFVFAGTFGYVLIPIDLHQRIAATLTTRPFTLDRSRYEVRIMFYRVVWKGEGYVERSGIPPGAQHSEMIRDAELYQQFFAKLSKAVFLEAHRL